MGEHKVRHSLVDHANKISLCVTNQPMHLLDPNTTNTPDKNVHTIINPNRI